jgi:hypothetical protein
MKNDITRDTFHRVKHFSRVLMQQGRVQLDADWNEQVSILLNYLQTIMVDLVGPSAGPASACGFGLLLEAKDIDALSLSPEETKALKDQLKKEGALIAPGRYYVGGLLAENERVASFFQQPSKPFDADGLKKMQNEAKGPLLIYLDVWERHITAIEDDRIRESALGGPDTATRAKVTWVMRARVPTAEEAKVNLPPTKPNIPKVQAAFDAWGDAQMQRRGLMRADIEQQSPSDDPCANLPESGYRGLENQLYRVEIHRGGTAWNGDKATLDDAATFKWSRDNGSVASAWLDSEDEILKVTASRDQARGFASGQWIELSDDLHDLESVPGTLVQLKETEAGSLTIDPQTAGGSVDRSQFKSNPKVRRWDQQATETIELNKGAIPIVEDEWITLEDGVQIQFQKPAEAAGGGSGEPHQYRTGDYSLIPARVATRDIEWPWAKNSEREILKDGEGKPIRLALPPHGITHHYALLGLLAAKTGGALEFTDLRRKFAALGNV